MIRLTDNLIDYKEAREAAYQRYQAELRQIDQMMLRTSQVAKYFGVTRQSVYRWVEAGILNSYDGGDLGLLFDPEDVAAFQRPAGRWAAKSQAETTYAVDGRLN
jgi:excisionase family DNA binding protein